MTSRRDAVIVGSLRKGSFNRKLAHALVELAPESLSLEVVEIGQLPLYDRDLDDGDNPPSAWTEFRQRMTGYDAVMFVTPGYDRSLPAPLKNAIERGLTPVWS